MPMDFPDMKSLVDAAEVYKFRNPTPEESEIEYRTALADHVASIDFIASEEIRNGVGWNRWNLGQQHAMLGRGLLKNK